MPRGRNFTRRSFRHASKRSSVVKSVTIVAPENGHPFICPLCVERDDEKEYLRIYLEKSPNAVCVHSTCLVDFLRKKNYVHSRREVLYVRPNLNHGQHDGMKPHGMADA